MSMSHTTTTSVGNGDTGTLTTVVTGQQQQTNLVQQQQLMQLSDMTDLSSEMQEEIVSIPKELILITLVSQEQALYNPKHENYRNTPCKDGKWEDIANSVGWTETQCKSKWKAMRDQYCRELKRSKFNAKAHVKWKYFRELEFLRPYALSRNYRPRLSVNNNNSNNNNNRFNPNNANIISSAATINQHSSTNNSSTCSEHTFGQIKIESVPFSSCDFVTAVSTTPTNTITQIKTEDGARLLTTLTDEQLHSVMQHQQQQQQADSNWNYLTATTSTPTTLTRTIGSGGGNSGGGTQQQQSTSSANDEALYCAIVNCVAAVTAGDMQQSLQPAGQQQMLNPNTTHNNSNNNEEEDDDPIHTFLNIESYFEKELIAMIQQEDVLYNSYHPDYRHVKRKLEVWEDIARKLKKTVKQCRLKWKALRDQYIREHKRLKNRENVESLPRWKHYDALIFLQKFIKHKTNDFDAKNLMQMQKTELDEEMDEQLIGSNSPLHVSPLRSPTLDEAMDEHELQAEAVSQLQQQILPSLTGPHTQQQQQQQLQLQQEFRAQQLHAPNSHETAICVMTSLTGDAGAVADADDSNAIAGTGAAGSGSGHASVSGYDEMDIDTYIIGDGSDEPHNDVIGDANDDVVVGVTVDEQDEEEEEDEEEEDDIENENEHDDDDEVAVVEDNEEHKSQQHFPHFNHNSNSTGEQAELEDIKGITQCNSKTVQLIVQSQQQQQQQSQSKQQQTLKQQQTQHILNINVAAANISESLQQEQPTNGQQGLQQAFQEVQAAGRNNTVLLTNGLSNSHQQEMLTEAAMQCSSNKNNGLHVVATAGVAAAAAAAALPAACMVAPIPTTDDDEVGAFFKAVAMKIRNAKMSPIAFTDLQIDILRVINGSLRQH